MEVTINATPMKALIDTGASVSLMAARHWTAWAERGLKLKPLPVTLVTVSGAPIKTHGQIQMNVYPFGKVDLCIVDISADMVIGSDILQTISSKIDYRRKNIEIDGRPFPFTTTDTPSLATAAVTLKTDVPDFLCGVTDHPVFDERLGHCTVAKPVRIHTIGAPIKQRPYRLNLLKRQIVNDEIDKMIQLGVITPSQSPWGSPITLVNKKDNSIRFCVDYRRLNSITQKDAYPVPLIQDIFDTLQGATVFTTLDLRSGYWQVDVAKEDRPKTAFVCHRGLFEFCRLPFGLTNAPAQFQRIMNGILHKHLGQRAMVYLDDVVIFSRSTEDHVKDVKAVLETIHEAGLTLKKTKCTFGARKVELLGYTVSDKGISQQVDKVEAIRDMTPPADLKALQRFLGMTGYYRQTIHNYADKAEPLVRLTKKGTPFVWGPEQQEAFQGLKQEMTSDRVMAHPNIKKPYKLYTDASNYAIGAILAQEDAKGVERPIHFVSKQLTAGQKKWSAMEREAYAIIYSLKKLRAYLQGAEFTIYTDHKPLRSLFQCEVKNTRVQRWAILISEFGPKIEYRSGSNNTRADMLSRLPEVSEVASIQETLHAANVGHQQKEVYPDEWTMAETSEELEEEADYIIMGNELYSLRLPYEGATPYPRLLAPPSLQPKLLQEGHLETGHRGQHSLLRRLQAFTVWPGMRDDVKNYIRSCPHCQGNRRNPLKTRPDITDTPHRPFERIGIDLTGPFLPSFKGNKYLLNAVDHLTGWAECYPIPDKRAITIWTTLKTELFPRHGHPRTVITDMGLEFNNSIMTEGLRSLNIEHKRTTPYHPQTNGVVERFHRTLKDSIRKLVNNQTARWEEELGQALWAYRVSDSKARGSSPFYLLYGREPDRPDIEPTEDTRHATMVRAWRFSNQQQEAAKQRRQEMSHGQPLVDRRIAVGDMITVDAPEAITLAHLRDHAFRVVEVRGKVIGYVPVSGPHQNKIKRVHIDRVQVAPPNISWDDIKTRPRRNRSDQDVRTLTLPPHFPTDKENRQPDRANLPYRTVSRTKPQKRKRPQWTVVPGSNDLRLKLCRVADPRCPDQPTTSTVPSADRPMGRGQKRTAESDSDDELYPPDGYQRIASLVSRQC